MKTLESMSDFFTARADGYDTHMLNNVEGCREAYRTMAALVPKETRNLLDLGCGTGLELDEIFKILPFLSVTGIDLTQAMLNKLREKHPDKNLNLICGSYFSAEFGENRFDCAVSFQTMHHYSHKMKIELYKKIYHSLTYGGMYIECDYMVERQSEEDFYFSENARLRREMGIGEREFYHYDTPCTVDNQIKMLYESGFQVVKSVFRISSTSIVTAAKLHCCNE